MKRFLALTAVLSSGLLAAACGGATGSASSDTSSTPHAGGKLTVGLESAFHAIDPLKATGISDYDVDGAVYEPLFGLSPNGTAQPVLATSYAVSNGGKTYTLALRQGVHFQDGTPFNAAAVKFNLERMADPKNACACASSLQNLSSVSTQGDYSVVIQLKRPWVPFVSEALGVPVSFMVSPTAVRKYGANIGSHPVGTGPFAFSNEIPGNSVTFTKWSGYWQPGKPYLDAVTFKAIADDQSRFASLQSGAVQTDENVAYNEYAQAKSASGIDVQTLAALGTRFVTFNMTMAPFNDVRARRAVTYATDAVALNKGLNDGIYSQPVESPWPPGSPGYPGNSVPGYPSYDLTKAKQLVQQLGGLSFTLQLANDPVTQRLAEALQSEWAKAGIKATILEREKLTATTNVLAHRYQADIFRWKGGSDPDVNAYAFYKSGSPANFSGLSDPAVDRLLDQGRTTNDPARRAQVYRDLAAQLAKDAPTDYLWGFNSFRALRSTVHGIPTLPGSILELTNAYV